MIQDYIDKFQEIKPQLLAQFEQDQPFSYEDILVKTLSLMFKDSDEYNEPNYTNVHVINDGHYQGILLFIIPEGGYQPSIYWLVKVDYGSCSVCDTYQRYCTWDSDEYKESAPHMVTMAMHMIESMKLI